MTTLFDLSWLKKSDSSLLSFLNDNSNSLNSDSIANRSITYSFYTDINQPDPSRMSRIPDGQAADFKPFTDTQKNDFKAITEFLSRIVNLSFSEVQAGTGQIRIGNHNIKDPVAGYANYPNSTYQVLFVENELISDDYGLGVIWHEFGHALGLKHPFEGDYQINKTLDSSLLSVMSYNDISPVPGNAPCSYAPLDIYRLLQMYGPSTNIQGINYKFQTNQDNVNQSFDGNIYSINMKPKEIFWACGTQGYDTIDVSSCYDVNTVSKGVTLDALNSYLRWDSEYTSLRTYDDSNSAWVDTAINPSANVYFYPADNIKSFSIEKITLTSRNDMITIGNDFKEIAAGGGDDVFTGFFKNVSIDGGEGLNTLKINANSTDYNIIESEGFLLIKNLSSSYEMIAKNIRYISFMDKNLLFGNASPTGIVSIAGVLKLGSYIHANNTISDENGLGTINYQWLRDGKLISNETNPFYKITSEDEAHNISVLASYKDGYGFNEKVASNQYLIDSAKNNLTGFIKIPGESNFSLIDPIASSKGDGSFAYYLDVDGNNKIDQTDVVNQKTYEAVFSDLALIKNVKFIVPKTYNLYDYFLKTMPNEIWVSEGIMDRSQEVYWDKAKNDLSLRNAGVLVIVEPSTTPEKSDGFNIEPYNGYLESDFKTEDAIYTIKYQWYKGEVKINNATNPSYKLEQFDENQSIHLRISYEDLLGRKQVAISKDFSEKQVPFPGVFPISKNKMKGTASNDVIDDNGNKKITLYGDLGDDKYIIHTSKKIIEQRESGKDTIYSYVDYILPSNTENLFLIESAVKGKGNSMDNLIIGSSSNNSLDGSSGNDTILGESGNDFIIGGTGDDILQGNIGIDTLNGGGGDDDIYGGDGQDILIGGKGYDTFFIKYDSEPDIVRDFETYIDRIGVDADIFNKGNFYLSNTTLSYRNDESNTIVDLLIFEGNAPTTYDNWDYIWYYF